MWVGWIMKVTFEVLRLGDDMVVVLVCIELALVKAARWKAKVVVASG
jgi:hypothetical protein